MPEKLSDLDSEFRTHHHNLIDDEEELAKEQEMPDGHDDLVAKLHVCVRRVITAPPSNASSYRVMSRISLGPRPLRGVHHSLSGLRRYEKGPGIYCSRMRQE